MEQYCLYIDASNLRSTAIREHTSKFCCEPLASSANGEQEVAASTTTTTGKFASSITSLDPEHHIMEVLCAACARFHAPTTNINYVSSNQHFPTDFLQLMNIPRTTPVKNVSPGSYYHTGINAVPCNVPRNPEMNNATIIAYHLPSRYPAGPGCVSGFFRI